MIRDSQARFEENVAITVTRVSTDTYDLGAALRDIGNLEDLWLYGVVTEAFTAAGAATLACDLIDDDNAALASPATIHPIMAATGKATLVLGYEMFKLQLPVNKMTQRYLGLNWTVATGPMTAGKVSAFFTRGIDAQRYYPKGHVNF